MYAEFLELPQHIQPWKPKGRDGWRRGMWSNASFEVNLSWLLRLARPERLVEVRRDRERIDPLIKDIAERGIDCPGLILLDTTGKLVLKDGHHRLVALGELRAEKMPVRLKPVDKIRLRGEMSEEVARGLLFDFAEFSSRSSS